MEDRCEERCRDEICASAASRIRHFHVGGSSTRRNRVREMTDERWESAELQLLVYSRHSDSRSLIEYRLSNIRRHEQPAHLFEKPADHTVDSSSTSKDPQMSSMLAEKFRAERAR
jgi:hypothetical protein